MMARLTYDICRGIVHFLFKCWPLFLFLLVRQFGAYLWVHTVGIESLIGARGLPASYALGPAIILAIAVFAYLGNLANMTTVKIAEVALVLSLLLSVVEELFRLNQFVPGNSWPGVLVSYFDASIGVAVVVGGGLVLAARWLTDRKGNLAFNAAFRRGGSGLHGTAEWLDMKTAAEQFATGGMILGEAYDVGKGQGPKWKAPFDPSDAATWSDYPLLRYDGSTDTGNVLVFNGPGGGKTAGVGVPTSLEWQNSMVYLDPSKEVFGLVADTRSKMRDGRRVIALDPEIEGIGFNALDWIDPTRDIAIEQIQTVVSWLADERRTSGTSGGDYFQKAGRQLIACLLSDMIFADDIPPEGKTLSELRKVLTKPQPELREVLAEIFEKGESYGFGYPAQMAGNLKDVQSDQFDGFYGEASNMTDWLAVPSLARLVSGSTFNTADLARGDTDVFIQIGLQTLAATPGCARVIVGALLNGVFRANGAVNGRVLFLLDEAHQLGYFKSLEIARDNSRKYKISLLLLFQSIGQVEQSWGREGCKAWMEAAYIRVFAGIADEDTKELVSKGSGEFTAIQESVQEGEGGSRRLRDGVFDGSSSSNRGTNRTEVVRRLIKADEIGRLRSDEQITLIKNSPPMRCGRAFYFRRRDMVGRVGQRRF